MAQPAPLGSQELMGALQAAAPRTLLTSAAPMPSLTHSGLRAHSLFGCPQSLRLQVTGMLEMMACL